MCKTIILYIILFIIVYILLYILNKLLSYEHMSMKDNYLKTTLNKHGININIDKLRLEKCDNNNNCNIKQYDTKNFNSLD